MNLSLFKDDNHAQGYAELIDRDGTHDSDIERKALFFCLAAMDNLRKSAGTIYNFKDHGFNNSILDRMLFSSGEQALVRLGFNLYSGGTAYSKGRGQKNLDCSVMSIVESMDRNLVTVALNAIRIRKGMAQ